MVAVLFGCGVILPLIGPVAVSALVQDLFVALHCYRVRHLTGLLQSVLSKFRRFANVHEVFEDV